MSLVTNEVEATIDLKSHLHTCPSTPFEPNRSRQSKSCIFGLRTSHFALILTTRVVFKLDIDLFVALAPLMHALIAPCRHENFLVDVLLH